MKENDETMVAITLRERFVRAEGESFQLLLAPGQTLDVTLQTVEERKAMNVRYECFSLLFLLPAEVQLPQAVYRLGHEGDCWDLLMTPTRPDETGRQGLEAIFHREKESALQTV